MHQTQKKPFHIKDNDIYIAVCFDIHAYKIQCGVVVVDTQLSRKNDPEISLKHWRLLEYTTPLPVYFRHYFQLVFRFIELWKRADIYNKTFHWITVNLL